MSIRHCLTSAVEQRAISQAAADELDLLYNRFVDQFALIHGDAEARRRAQEEIAKRLETSALQRRRVALLQASAIERTHEAVFSYKNARGEIDPARALLELLETHGTRDEGLATGSVAGRQKAILGAALAEMEGLLDTFSKTLAGGRANRAQLENVVRELFGQDTGDAAAKAFAKAWADTAEGLRQRYNENGGAIGKLENWALPQQHDGQALRKVGFKDWARRISDLLDWDRMRHALSGTPILPDERQEVLRHVFDTVTTDGWANRLPDTKPQGRGALYKQHADHRFLVFKDADSWLAYARDFGEGDPFAAMMGHLGVMSRDIAAMQILGPNPEATLTWLKGETMREAQKARRGEAANFARGPSLLGVELSNPVSRASYAIHRAETMWAHYSGAADVAAGQALAATMTTLRNATSAGSLGSAMLSAISDPGFGAMARSFATGASVPGSLVNQAGAVVDALRGMTRAEAVRAGLILDAAANTFGEKAREANAISGPVISRYMADTVMRVQGLAAWTQAGKHGFGLWLMGELADRAGTGWAELTPEVQRLMRRYGLGETEWNVIRMAAPHDLSPDGQGAHVLRPREIARMTVHDLKRMQRWDREDRAAAVAALAYADRQIVSVGDEVATQVNAIIDAANRANLSALAIQQMIARTLFPNIEASAVPKALRDRLMGALETRASLLATLRDMAEGGWARTETARVRWRETPEFQALPPWLRDIFGDPEISLDEARQVLRQMAEPAAMPRRPEGAPSIPSDPVDAKVGRYFRNLAERYHEMILQETAYAVPEPTLRSKAITLGGTRPGTIQGEAFRAFGQFKSFGIAVALLHGGRLFNELAQGRKAAGAVYAGAALATLTMLGMVSMQAKQIAKGEDPRDMTDWRNWSAAMVQAGGFGIYGDFFLADQNRLGGGLVQTIVGPVPGRAADLMKATIGNIQEASDPTKLKTNAGRELLKNVKAFDPLASLWFTRTAWDRLVYANQQRAVDPEAALAFERQVQVARRDRKTGYWWRPGAGSPERMPDLGNALGAGR